MTRVGVLALQGDFREHELALERLGCEVTEVRLPRHLEGLAGVVIPGGESTTIAKLMQSYGLDEGLREFHRGGGWLWGSCAGAIVLASELAGFPGQPRLGLLDVTVARNDYGRQVASFEADLDIGGLDDPFRALFIRAPRILRAGPGVEVAATWRDEPVFVTGERLFATVFHPELGGDDRVHALVLRRAAAAGARAG
jgi:5'-phosphate synthase pdxT subunit